MSTDTRHPQYDDATLLAVMDDACQETHTKHPEVGGTILLASDFNTVAWPAEKPARLALARGLLARLPEPTPPWQPAVGEPVRLVSGGPEMTVTHTDSDNIIVAWFDLSEVNTMNFPAACLVSAKEAQP